MDVVAPDDKEAGLMDVVTPDDKTCRVEREDRDGFTLVVEQSGEPTQGTGTGTDWGLEPSWEQEPWEQEPPRGQESWEQEPPCGQEPPWHRATEASWRKLAEPLWSRAVGPSCCRSSGPPCS